MRLLHTSDWHLGQHFMGKTRQAEHQALIDWVVQQAEQQAVDALLLVGDVFDSGTPPSYARALYSQLVVGLHRAGCALVVLGGNHDSVAVLEENRAMLHCLGATVIAAVDDDPAHQLLLLTDRAGQPGALLCATPFIRPRDVLFSQAGQSAEAKQLALQTAIQLHYQQLHQRAVAQREALGLPQLPIVATGHLTTVGASASESVREIYVGALEAFPTKAFPPADYIALGHIHRAQRVGGLDHIRYSGAPIALSFDEASLPRQLWRVDLDARGLHAVEALPVPCWQPLASVRGTLASLPAALAQAARASLDGQPVWLEVTVDSDDYLADLSARIQALTDGLPLEVLRIRRARGQASARLQAEHSETLDQLSPQDVFARRLAQEDLSAELQQQLQLRHQQILDQLQGPAA